MQRPGYFSVVDDVSLGNTLAQLLLELDHDVRTDTRLQKVFSAVKTIATPVHAIMMLMANGTGQKAEAMKAVRRRRPDLSNTPLFRATMSYLESQCRNSKNPFAACERVLSERGTDVANRLPPASIESRTALDFHETFKDVWFGGSPPTPSYRSTAPAESQPGGGGGDGGDGGEGGGGGDPPPPADAGDEPKKITDESFSGDSDDVLVQAAKMVTVAAGFASHPGQGVDDLSEEEEDDEAAMPPGREVTKPRIHDTSSTPFNDVVPAVPPASVVPVASGFTRSAFDDLATAKADDVTINSILNAVTTLQDETKFKDLIERQGAHPDLKGLAAGMARLEHLAQPAATGNLSFEEQAREKKETDAARKHVEQAVLQRRIKELKHLLELIEAKREEVQSTDADRLSELPELDRVLAVVMKQHEALEQHYLHESFAEQQAKAYEEGEYWVGTPGSVRCGGNTDAAPSADAPNLLKKVAESVVMKCVNRAIADRMLNPREAARYSNVEVFLTEDKLANDPSVCTREFRDMTEGLAQIARNESESQSLVCQAHTLRQLKMMILLYMLHDYLDDFTKYVVQVNEVNQAQQEDVETPPEDDGDPSTTEQPPTAPAKSFTFKVDCRQEPYSLFCGDDKKLSELSETFAFQRSDDNKGHCTACETLKAKLDDSKASDMARYIDSSAFDSVVGVSPGASVDWITTSQENDSVFGKLLAVLKRSISQQNIPQIKNDVGVRGMFSPSQMARYSFPIFQHFHQLHRWDAIESRLTNVFGPHAYPHRQDMKRHVGNLTSFSSEYPFTPSWDGDCSEALSLVSSPYTFGKAVHFSLGVDTCYYCEPTTNPDSFRTMLNDSAESGDALLDKDSGKELMAKMLKQLKLEFTQDEGDETAPLKVTKERGNLRLSLYVQAAFDIVRTMHYTYMLRLINSEVDKNTDTASTNDALWEAMQKEQNEWKFQKLKKKIAAWVSDGAQSNGETPNSFNLNLFEALVQSAEDALSKAVRTFFEAAEVERLMSSIKSSKRYTDVQSRIKEGMREAFSNPRESLFERYVDSHMSARANASTMAKLRSKTQAESIRKAPVTMFNRLRRELHGFLASVMDPDCRAKEPVATEKGTELVGFTALYEAYKETGFQVLEVDLLEMLMRHFVIVGRHTSQVLHAAELVHMYQFLVDHVETDADPSLFFKRIQDSTSLDTEQIRFYTKFNLFKRIIMDHLKQGRKNDSLRTIDGRTVLPTLLDEAGLDKAGLKVHVSSLLAAVNNAEISKALALSTLIKSQPELMVKLANHQLFAVFLSMCMRLCFVMEVSRTAYTERAPPLEGVGGDPKVSQFDGSASGRESTDESKTAMLQKYAEAEGAVVSGLVASNSQDLYFVGPYSDASATMPDLAVASSKDRLAHFAPYVFFFRALCLRQKVVLRPLDPPPPPESTKPFEIDLAAFARMLQPGAGVVDAVTPDTPYALDASGVHHLFPLTTVRVVAGSSSASTHYQIVPHDLDAYAIENGKAMEKQEAPLFVFAPDMFQWWSDPADDASWQRPVIFGSGVVYQYRRTAAGDPKLKEACLRFLNVLASFYSLVEEFAQAGYKPTALVAPNVANPANFLGFDVGSGTDVRLRQSLSRRIKTCADLFGRFYAFAMVESTLKDREKSILPTAGEMATQMAMLAQNMNASTGAADTKRRAATATAVNRVRNELRTKLNTIGTLPGSDGTDNINLALALYVA